MEIDRLKEKHGERCVEARLHEITFLSRSENRLRILEALAESDLSQSDLEEMLRIPHTTLHRNIQELSEKGWIDERVSEHMFELSVSGELVLESYVAALRTFLTANEVRVFHRHFPEQDVPSARTWCEHDIILSSEEEPYKPLLELRDSLGRSIRCTVITSTLHPMYAEELEGVSKRNGLELVGPPSFFRTLNANHPELLERAVNGEGVRVFAVDVVPDYGLWLLDEWILVETYDRNRRTHSVLRARRGDHDVSGWAESVERSLKEKADERDSERALVGSSG